MTLSERALLGLLVVTAVIVTALVVGPTFGDLLLAHIAAPLDGVASLPH